MYPIPQIIRLNSLLKIFSFISLFSGLSFFIYSCSSPKNSTSSAKVQQTYSASRSQKLLASLPTMSLPDSASCSSSSSAAIVPDAAGVVYIKPCGTGNGSSWDNAAGVGALRGAANLPSSVTALWLASGIYTPTDNSDSTAAKLSTFQLRSGLAIYGGFYGNEINLADRDIYAFPVVLCGRLDHSQGTCTGGVSRSYNVLVAEGVTSAVLDGVSLLGAKHDASGATWNGGGIYVHQASPTFRHLIIANNQAVYGGGVHIYNEKDASPVVFDQTLITENSATYGGGLYNSAGVITLNDLTFSQNSASQYGGALWNNGTARLNRASLQNNQSVYGGAIYALGPMLVQQTTFDGNSATYGGGIYNNGLIANAVANSTFIQNHAVVGPSIYNGGSPSLILNSILWDGASAVGGSNSNTYYSLTQGSTSQQADTNGNWQNGGSFADNFDASTDLNSSVSYYPIHGMPVNKGARVWFDGQGNLYLFPPYFEGSAENLSRSNYTKYSLSQQGWAVTSYQPLPSGAIELTATEVRGFWRESGDNLPDLGPYEYNAVSQYFLDPSLFGYESFNTDGLSVSPSGGVYFKQHDLLTTPKNTIMNITP